MGMRRRTDRTHPQTVVAYAAQRQPKGRVDKEPRAEKDHEQNGERISVSGIAVKIEAEAAGNRPSVNALQAVEAAGKPARAVGGFLQKKADTERDHDQG